MPALFNTYAKKLQTANRRVDATATPAQREAGNARVGKLFIHGLEVSVEYGPGSVRKGRGADGQEWKRIVNHSYGRINKTTAEDGEHFDVWVGPHPASQLAFTFSFLTDKGEHDETKAVLGCRNVEEAREVIRKNYPPNFLEERIGEVRGYFFPEFRRFLEKTHSWKTPTKKQAASFDLSALLRLRTSLVA